MRALEPGCQKTSPRHDQARPLYFSAPLATDGRTVSLERFRGRVMLIVNTASACGFTPQYAASRSSPELCRARLFECLGFPCNQFAGTGTGYRRARSAASASAITGSAFRSLQKSRSTAAGPSALSFPQEAAPGALGCRDRGRIAWNFTKFLGGRNGEVVARYAPASPEKLAPPDRAVLG